MDVVFSDLDPRFAALNVYLGELKRGRRMAALADLDPRGFGPWLPFLNLIDVVLAGDAVRFRFRLVGAAQSAAAQLQYQGRFVDDAVAPASRRRVIDDLTRVAATCRPQYGRYGMPFPGRGFVESERVFFPLSADDRMVDSILALHRYPALEEADAAGLAPQSWHLEAWRNALAGG